MKRFLTLILFAASLFGLSVTASYAGNSSGPAGCMPGCYCPDAANTATYPPVDPKVMTGNYQPPPGPNGMMNHGGILGMMEDHSNALRLRGKSYARQTIHQNDNGIGMTCYDHALGLTSRLGSIFSDVGAPAAFPGANTVVFKSPIYSAGAGSDKFLLEALNTVVMPQVSEHVNDFKDSLSNLLGAAFVNPLTGFMATIMGIFTGLLAPITTAVNNLNTAINTLNGFIGTLKTAMRALQFVIGLPFFATVTFMINAINLAWAAVKSFITATINAIQAIIKGLVTALMSWLMGSVTSMASNSGGVGGNKECDRIQELWGNGQPASFMTNGAGQDWQRALTQTGRQGGTPYFSIGEMLFQGGGPTGAGAELLSELANTSNTSIMNGALGDLGAGGGLNAPGNILSWPKSPVEPPRGTLPAAIISNM
jgi:hypothetical protein